MNYKWSLSKFTGGQSTCVFECLPPKLVKTDYQIYRPSHEGQDQTHLSTFYFFSFCLHRVSLSTANSRACDNYPIIIYWHSSVNQVCQHEMQAFKVLKCQHETHIKQMETVRFYFLWIYLALSVQKKICQAENPLIYRWLYRSRKFF